MWRSADLSQELKPVRRFVYEAEVPGGTRTTDTKMMGVKRIVL